MGVRLHSGAMKSDRRARTERGKTEGRKTDKKKKEGAIIIAVKGTVRLVLIFTRWCGYMIE